MRRKAPEISTLLCLLRLRTALDLVTSPDKKYPDLASTRFRMHTGSLESGFKKVADLLAGVDVARPKSNGKYWEDETGPVAVNLAMEIWLKLPDCFWKLDFFYQITLLKFSCHRKLVIRHCNLGCRIWKIKKKKRNNDKKQQQQQQQQARNVSGPDVSRNLDQQYWNHVGNKWLRIHIQPIVWKRN